MVSASTQNINTDKKVVLTDFEYNVITECNKYWCDLYRVNDIDADIIFSKNLFHFLENKKQNKIKAYNDNLIQEDKKELLIRSFIKISCKRVLVNYFKLKDSKKKPLILNESELQKTNEFDEIIYESLTTGKSTIDEIIENDVKNKLLYIYDSLTDKEQELYDVLSSTNVNTRKRYTKSEVCKLINITADDYDNYIKKLKKIICVVLNIKENE